MSMKNANFVSQFMLINYLQGQIFVLKKRVFAAQLLDSHWTSVWSVRTQNPSPNIRFQTPELSELALIKFTIFT
jgi:hypothetical protein